MNMWITMMIIIWKSWSINQNKENEIEDLLVGKHKPSGNSDAIWASPLHAFSAVNDAFVIQVNFSIILNIYLPALSR
jgi:hypothetical protein